MSLHRIINKEFYLNEYLQILAVICVTQTPNPSRARAPEPLSDVSHDSDIIQEGDKHKKLVIYNLTISTYSAPFVVIHDIRVINCMLKMTAHQLWFAGFFFIAREQYSVPCRYDV